uniref:DNA2/NAM7 helicase helicase domain-containing protein n=1 Tax=Glossina morsitans morsitans TaxID=37546 RepID=A0A1B0FBK4_GLOMM
MPSDLPYDNETTTTASDRMRCIQNGEFIRLVSKNHVEKELIPEHFMPYCATMGIGIDDTCKSNRIVTKSGLKLKRKKYLGRHRVTIGTCATLDNFLQMSFPSNHFTHVLIDDTSQCTETEIMIAVAQGSKERGQVILAGDPHQLQAIFMNKYALEHGKLYRKTIKPECIGIMTPYMKQVKHLCKLFVNADVAMPKIGSMEEFQGQNNQVHFTGNYVAVNDLILKLLTQLTKVAISMMSTKLLRRKARARLYVLVEYASQFYRPLAPTTQWLFGDMR